MNYPLIGQFLRLHHNHYWNKVYRTKFDHLSQTKRKMRKEKHFKGNEETTEEKRSRRRRENIKNNLAEKKWRRVDDREK